MLEDVLMLKIIAAVAACIAFYFLLNNALTTEALNECRKYEQESQTYGDVAIPDWCKEVPGWE